ncbi:MAG: MarR family transcriptional regulator [Rhodospirillales bacterium]|jgi:MarR family transcriptional regulator for hemolysin
MTRKTPRNLGRQTGLLARLWRTELDNRLRPLGLSQARWILLMHLNDNADGMSQLDLATRAGVSAATLVRQIDQLEEAELVERCPHPEDRRANLVHLTELGRARFQQVDAIAAELRQEVLGDFDPGQVNAMIDFTTQLIGRFEALSASAEKGVS